MGLDNIKNITKMKNLSLLVIMLFMSSISFAQDKVIPENELPKEIKTYLSTHFPDNAVLQAMVDKEVFSKSYEVILQDNFTVEFNSKNKVKEISGNSKLPDSVIPNEILAYVKTNYPNNVITDWELDDNNQQVELDNDINLEFTMTGQFLRIDD